MSEIILMCDQKEPDGSACGAPAVVGYRWDWGQEGACCARHAQLLEQTARNLSTDAAAKRGVTTFPLQQPAETPLERSERTQLIASRLSAEAEADELRNRGAELYRQNVDLTKQITTLSLQKREADAALRLAEKKQKQLEEKLKDRELELGTVTDELQRLQTLAAFAPDTKAETGAKKEGAKTKG